MNVSFLDLKKNNARFKDEFDTVFNSFLDSGHYVLGNNVTAFEEEFADYCGVSCCVGTGNGLDALMLILKAYIELGKLNLGDEVLVAANTFIATILAIKNEGLKPVLVEPNENTYNLDNKELLKKRTLKTKVILVTHLYGQLADMSFLRSFASENKMVLISDSAQAHGAKDTLGNKAGSLADASGFSFYPSKNLGALGDGGAIVTNNTELAECIRKLRNYGTSSKYVNEYCGVNSRLDEIQAGILRVKLPYLDKDNQNRRNIAKQYLGKINNPCVELPKVIDLEAHVFHLFVIKVDNRIHFMNYLKENHIETLIHYPIPPHNQLAFKNILNGDYPITEKLANMVVSLPISPVMSQLDVNCVIKAVNEYKCDS